MAPKQVFKNLIMAISGDFGDGGRHNNRTHAHLTNWITLHGGQVLSDVTKETTHLICSVEDYAKKSSRMRKAKCLGRRQCKIVAYEWIEESLIPRKQLKPTEIYEHDFKDKERRRLKKEQTRSVEYYGKQIASTIDLVDGNLYHHYHDSTGFRLAVVLSKVTLNTKKDDGRTLRELYTIYMFESNGKPSLYQIGTKLKIGSRKPAWGFQHCYDMEFDKAFLIFRKMFKKETGIDWDHRLDGIKRELNPHQPEEFYVYSPPPADKPRGVLPFGWVDTADARAIEGSSTTDDTETTDENSDSEGSKNVGESSDSNESETSKVTGSESKTSNSSSGSGMTESIVRQRYITLDEGDEVVEMVTAGERLQGWMTDMVVR